ncbi:hypothetical protein [Thaumasiovibrio sp. DFM-14]|uniref:hypothetical protein n=1 Tax=Thaumasiovibrio sp. DFM-14 TaxID=3384792 RepID=UPI00399F9FA1
MARIDWKSHAALFTQERENNPSLSVQQYCEDKGLNVRTARRHIKVGGTIAEKKAMPPVKQKASKTPKKGAIDWPVLYEGFLLAAIKEPDLSRNKYAEKVGYPAPQVRRAFKKLHESAQFAQLEKELDQAIAQFKADKVRKAKAKKSGPARLQSVTDADRRGTHAIAHTDNDADLPNSTDRGSSDPSPGTANRQPNGQFGPGNTAGRQFGPGNTFGMIHGGYASILNLDDEVIEALRDSNHLDLTTDLVERRARKASVKRYIRERKLETIEAYENGNPETNMDGEPIPLTEALARIEFGMTSQLSALDSAIDSATAILAKQINDTTKLAHADHKLGLSAQEKVAIQVEAYKRRVDNGWTAEETALWIEANGGEVPKHLAAQAAKELADQVPEVDDDGLTEEELDQMAVEYWTDAKQKELDAKVKAVGMKEMIADMEARQENGLQPQQQDDDEQYLELDDEDFNDGEVLSGFEGFEEEGQEHDDD